MKQPPPSAARALWDSMTARGPRRATEAVYGFHESSLELQQGLEVQEMPLAQLPAEMIRQLISRRAPG